MNCTQRLQVSAGTVWVLVLLVASRMLSLPIENDTKYTICGSSVQQNYINFCNSSSHFGLECDADC